jgi:hypothetical protein
MTDNTVLYTRGYFGYISDSTRKDDNKQSVNDIVHNTKYNIETKKGIKQVSNLFVDELWNMYNNHDIKFTNFYHREKILTTAMDAFYTDSFLNWCKLQTSSPYFSSIHKQFLNETFSYLEGRSRSMTITTWPTIIFPADLKQGDVDHVYKLDDYFDDATTPLKRVTKTSMHETLVRWTCQENGFEDLLVSLHILFGKTDTQ